MSGDVDKFKELFEEHFASKKDADYYTHIALKNAIESNHINIVQSIYSKSENITHKNLANSVSWACEFGQKDILTFLLNHHHHGIRPDRFSGFIRTSVIHSQPEILKVLFDIGKVGTLNIKDSFDLVLNRTDDISFLKLLLEYGANPNKISIHDLHDLIKTEKREQLCLLFDAGLSLSSNYLLFFESINLDQISIAVDFYQRLTTEQRGHVLNESETKVDEIKFGFQEIMTMVETDESLTKIAENTVLDAEKTYSNITSNKINNLEDFDSNSL
ncbi:MAG: ankyrin repeat domain-containing protein [Endozoicomonadaceae bacterium]|nr:ankyrin repeat domain-containing protein [Endozoicomonadaceae bacterium]